MAAAPIAGGGDENGVKQRSAEIKVYTRKAFRGLRNKNSGSVTASATVSTTTNNNNEDGNCKNANTIVQSCGGVENFNNNSIRALPCSVVSEDGNLSQQQTLLRVDAASDDLSRLNAQEPVGPVVRITQDLPSGNGVVQTGFDNQRWINKASKTKQEMQDLRRKFEVELETVRNLVKRIEEIQGKNSSRPSYSRVSTMEVEVVDNCRGANHAHSEVGSVGVPPDATRRLRKLSISVLENGKGVNDFMDREKRTPKANQFYLNSEFLLAKDRIPPAESIKKSKVNGHKNSRGKLKHGFGIGTKFFNACVSLLEKLMKHKNGWVFNAPVDVEGLGLHDYFSIIKHPMDLGTVKTRLNKNWYKSPKEFAEDVRLTFHNAMTYNPKGQDVHVMADQLLKIFEERWGKIESGYYYAMRLGLEYGAALPTPTSRRAPPLPLPPNDMRKILERSDSTIYTANSKIKQMSMTPPVRTHSLKKPKANDPLKRDMTYNEKQKLSTNLQSLPSEKLDAILQIIKKRNSEILQHDDEIEVDIDSVDTESLWELDRLVMNYRKSLSKNKRKAELANLKAQAVAEYNNNREKTPATDVAELPSQTKADEKIVFSSSPIREGEREDHRSKSSSSSSSSSDSGSSSSDSDSESSSISGSDTGSPMH